MTFSYRYSNVFSSIFLLLEYFNKQRDNILGLGLWGGQCSDKDVSVRRYSFSVLYAEKRPLQRMFGRHCLDVMEREATLQLCMKLGVQLHRTVISISNTVSILEVFNVKRARSAVHNWVHKADRQPENGRSPDHVAVNETVILQRMNCSIQRLN